MGFTLLKGNAPRFPWNTLLKGDTHRFPWNVVCTDQREEPRYWDFPGGPVVKNLPCSAGETGVGSLVPEDSTRGGATKSMVNEIHMPLLRPEEVKKKTKKQRDRNPDRYNISDVSQT